MIKIKCEIIKKSFNSYKLLMKIKMLWYIETANNMILKRIFCFFILPSKLFFPFLIFYLAIKVYLILFFLNFLVIINLWPEHLYMKICHNILMTKKSRVSYHILYFWWNFCSKFHYNNFCPYLLKYFSIRYFLAKKCSEKNYCIKIIDFLRKK